jgi:uncharacterized membrane protein
MILGIVSILIVALSLIVITVFKVKRYSLIIYGCALCLLWATSLQGYYVVGTDASGEVYTSNVIKSLGWDWSWYNANNTSLVIGYFLPGLAKLFGVSVVWIYKVVLPIIFALAPVLLFKAFEKQIGTQKAAYAAFFFIIMPVFSLEIVSIGKSMVAEMFMAAFIYLMVSDWDKYLRFIGMFLCVMLCLWCHYTVGIILLAYLVCIVLVRLVNLVIKWGLFKNWGSPIWVLPVILLIGMSAWGIYYSNQGGGSVAKHAETVENHFEVMSEKISDGTYAGQHPETYHKEFYLNSQPPLVRTALMLDFFDTDLKGQIFRIIQALTQLLIIIGCFVTLFRYKRYKFKAEFIAGIGASFALLLLCIFIPQFSSIINMTRFYHLSLFFLAPMFVLGFDVVKGD